MENCCMARMFLKCQEKMRQTRKVPGGSAACTAFVPLSISIGTIFCPLVLFSPLFARAKNRDKDCQVCVCLEDSRWNETILQEGTIHHNSFHSVSWSAQEADPKSEPQSNLQCASRARLSTCWASPFASFYSGKCCSHESGPKQCLIRAHNHLSDILSQAGSSCGAKTWLLYIILITWLGWFGVFFQVKAKKMKTTS